MARRRPHANSIWPTRRGPGYQHVRPEGDLIELWVADGRYLDGMPTGIVHQLSRADARLIAKRLNQCLDATVLR